MPHIMGAADLMSSPTVRAASILADHAIGGPQPIVNAGFDVVWDDDRRTLSVGFEEYGQPFRLVFTSWEDGIRWARVAAGESERMPLDLDPGLPLLDPTVTWAHPWQDCIPHAVRRMLEPFTTERWALLAWASRSQAALDLLLSAPMLLWLLLVTASRQGWSESHIEACLIARRRDILAACGLHPAPSTLKRLARLEGPHFDRHTYAWIVDWLGDAHRVRALAHYPTLHQTHRRLLHAFPDFAATVIVRHAPDSLDDLTEFKHWVTDSLRMARQLGREGETIKALGACRDLAALQRVHDRLTAYMNAASVRSAMGCEGAEAATLFAMNTALAWVDSGDIEDVAYGSPPVPGTDAIIPIRSRRELADEGREQQHCVLSYHTEIRSGRYWVYRVLQPERCTLGLTLTPGIRPRIDQLKGYRNGSVDPETRAMVQAWLAEAGQAEATESLSRRWVRASEPPMVEASALHQVPPQAVIEIVVNRGELHDSRYGRPAVMGVVAIGRQAHACLRAWQQRGTRDPVDFLLVDPATAQIDEDTLCSVRRNAPAKVNSGIIDQENAETEELEPFSSWIDEADMTLIVADLTHPSHVAQVRQLAGLSCAPHYLTAVIHAPPPGYAALQDQQTAVQARTALLPYVDVLICPVTDVLSRSLGERWNPKAARCAIDAALMETIQTLTGPISCPSLVGVDLADIRDVLQDAGKAYFASAVAQGPQRARRATVAALADLRTVCDLSRAHRAVAAITAGLDLSLDEYEEMSRLIAADLPAGACTVMAVMIDPGYEQGELRVSIIARGVQ